MTTRLRSPALSSTLAVLVALTTACASLQPTRQVHIDPRLKVGNMGERSDFEVRTETALAARAAATSTTPDTRPAARKPITPILFWLGIGLVAVGGVGTIGTASAGYATQRQLTSDYRGVADASDVQNLENRGSKLNQASIAGAAIAVIGAILALTSYGVDYTRCGPLAPKKRRNTAPPGRCADDDSK
jgi:hypothetical protein